MATLDQIKSLFELGCELPEGVDRQAWLWEKCAHDTELFAEVDSLLAALDQSRRRARSLDTLPRKDFGPFRAIRLLGKGGTSTVYQAQRVDGKYEQTVALKVVAPFLVGDDFATRITRERQFVATLNHPNIAHLIDGGTSESGDSYLAIEYVEGERLDTYCDHHRLSIDERLRLFLQVCEAVDYAHRKLIVHRDLKPGNILVSAEGTVKLLDFGTGALLLANPENDQTVAATRMVTPRYASPERLRGETASVSNDVFSLGVILYELLSGAWPFGDPSEPAAAVELLRNGAAAPVSLASAVAAGAGAVHGLPDSRLRTLLRGDLSLIAGKAIEIDPERRYQSVAALVTDVEAYLDGQPIRARRQDVAYRMQKWLRRNKVAVLFFGLLGGSLAAGTAGIAWQAHAAKLQAERAQAHAEELRKFSNTLLSDLEGALQKLPGSTEAQRVLVSAVTDHLSRVAKDVTADSQTQRDLVSGYVSLGNVQGNPYDQNLGDRVGALRSIEKGIAVAAQLTETEPGNPDDRRLLAWARQSKAEVLFGGGKAIEAVPVMREAVAGFAGLVKEPNPTIARLADEATAYGDLGDMLGQPGAGSLGDANGAAQAYGHVLDIDRRLARLDPANFRVQRGLILTQSKMANLFNDSDPVRALEGHSAALALWRGLSPDLRARVDFRRLRDILLRREGLVLRQLGEYEKAFADYEAARASAEEFLKADGKDSRAADDLFGSFEAEAEYYEDRVSEIFGPDEQRARDAQRALDSLEQMRKAAGGAVRAGQQRSVDAAGLVRAGRLENLLHTADGGLAKTEAGIKALKAIAADDNASQADLAQAAEYLAAAEPARLREPALAVRAGERAVALTGRRKANDLLALAGAYRAAGQVERARATALEGLRLLKPSGTRRFRLQILLENEAR